jgi:glycosyltransferase involved in cell wall biosynthesis
LRHGTLIAAIVQGLPIITTRSSAPFPNDRLPRLISDENVILIPPNDPASLVAAVERLLAEPTLRHTLAAGSRDVARQFEWDAIARQTLKLYEEVTS